MLHPQLRNTEISESISFIAGSYCKPALCPRGRACLIPPGWSLKTHPWEMEQLGLSFLAHPGTVNRKLRAHSEWIASSNKSFSFFFFHLVLSLSFSLGCILSGYVWWIRHKIPSCLCCEFSLYRKPRTYLPFSPLYFPTVCLRSFICSYAWHLIAFAVFDVQWDSFVLPFFFGVFTSGFGKLQRAILVILSLMPH